MSIAAPSPAASPRTSDTEVTSCLHCGLPAATPSGEPGFCCPGCRTAYALIHNLGLDSYYHRRILDPGQRAMKPDAETVGYDVGRYIRTLDTGEKALSMVVDGLQCAACVWLIESVLAREAGVRQARVNMTTRRLRLTWDPATTGADRLIDAVAALGYRLVPFDPALVGTADQAAEKELVRAMAVAGFAAGNVMLLSVAIWAGHVEGMDPTTRSLFHWISALIALPAIAYAGRPFFRSALAVLSRRRSNMDVPISLAVLLAAGMSLHETIVDAPHAYFDSAITLLFFLLVGRFLDRRARGQARSAAHHLLSLRATAVTVVDETGNKRLVPPADLKPGMRFVTAAGERIAADGRISGGAGDIDTSLIDGESLPKTVGSGFLVHAGTLSLTAPLTITVTATGEDTLLAEMVRLMEAAEQGRGRYVTLADRVARAYAPLVHCLALAAFVGWLASGAEWQQALLIAVAVLIITCPCALALAVPVVQVVASGRLMRRGVLIKSATALERIADTTTVVFDKTGTLTIGRAALVDGETIGAEVLRTACQLAAVSRHPLAQGLCAAAERRGIRVAAADNVLETPGRGLSRPAPGGTERLGSRSFCDLAEDTSANEPELWWCRPGAEPVRFTFADPPREDAAAVVATLRARGLQSRILSGDRPAAVGAVAERLGVDRWEGALRPDDKLARLASLADAGERPLMVGDGLNDAPALAAAHASMSPSSAIDISQTAADIVFQGTHLAPVPETLRMAVRARALVRQNIALAVAYNAVTIPLAVAGYVTPLIAAIAMSASSLCVIVNALRLNRD